MIRSLRAPVNAAVLIDLTTAADYRLPLSVVRGRTPMGGSWTWTDRVLAAAYREHLNGLCDGCGGVLEDTTDKDKFGRFGTHEHVHDAPVKCLRCESRAQKLDEYGKNEKYPRLLRWATRAVRRGD